MEKRGNRISYIYSYLEQSGGINYDAPGYFENEYELDAYYTQYLHKEGLIDKYGNKREILIMNRLPLIFING